MKNFLILSLITFSIIFGFFINGDSCLAEANSFNLSELFVNNVSGSETKASGVHSFEGAIGVIVKGVTGLIGGFAVLGTILGGFLILTSGGGEDGMNKGKKIIMYSLIGIAMSLVSYTLIQLLQIFLFSFN